MKRIIFTGALIFVICFATFAQTKNTQSRAVKISEYLEDYNSEKTKIAIFDLNQRLMDESGAEGIIKIQASTNNKITQQIIKIKGYLKFINVNPTRFSFALSNDNEQIIQYWSVPLGENIPDCENCIIIRAEDYNKLESFFRPKSKPRKRKK